MSKIFIKGIIALALMMNVVYGVKDIPSSTSSNLNSIKSQQSVQKLKKADTHTITFSEFSIGTEIRDQYADRGVIFKGDSPFITRDGSNPSSPVLSGTPKYRGAIEGHFVDPKTHEPTTVNHFELDGGYFDNLSSTKLSWYNSKGDLIREVFDSQFKIQTFSVDDEGIAYFKIEIVSEERAGYAIDNLSFEIQDITLDKITHQAGDPVANSFTIYLKSSNRALKEICSYDFFVEDANQKIEGTDCQVKDENRSKVNFRITKSPYNLENAKVTMCKDGSCKELKDIKEFSVYGTNFDVTKDGFSFQNGGWNKFMLSQDKDLSLSSYFCWKFDFCTDAQISYSGSMLTLVNVFKKFMPRSKRKEAELLIGYYKTEDYTEDYDNRDRKFNGVCHGLSLSAIANFNNKREEASWGSTLSLSNSKDEIVSVFQNHWNDRESESAKPFSNTLHTYDASNNMRDAFHSLGKIGYYFLSQSHYAGGEAWVGTHKREIFSTITKMNSYNEKYLKENRVSNLRFSLKPHGGHSILVSQLIKYNAHSLYVLHDNNFINTFTMLDFKKNLQLSKFIYHYNSGDSYDQYGDFKLNDFYGSSLYYDFGTYSDKTDTLFVYGKTNNIEKQVKKSQQPLQKIEKGHKTFEYLYPNHISITVVGGKVLKITDIESKKEVILNPTIGEIKENRAYLLDDMLLTEFLLPKGNTYKIELQKYKQYPTFEIYAEIPTDDGKVEIINYENLATHQDDTTLAHFLVGDGNDEKEIKREGESSIAPTYDEAIDMKITPATFIKAISLNQGIKLTWNLPNNPNLKEVVVVRKEGSNPLSITDGREIYRGKYESHKDLSAQNNRVYYYGIYTVAKNEEVADGQFIYVNTHQATLYGHVRDPRSNPVKNAQIVLKNGVGLVKKSIATERTDKNGFFSFKNLPLGTYLLEFSHPYYTFREDTMTVTLKEKGMRLSQEAVAQPMLAMHAHMIMKIDQNETISWDGVNISDEEKVNIKLKRGDSWETLASNIEFSQHGIHWSVTQPKDKNAILRVELVSDNTIFNEKKISIFDKKDLKYDFNRDGIIDNRDIMSVASQWRKKREDSDFKALFDLDNNGLIDIKDIMRVASKWGERN